MIDFSFSPVIITWMPNFKCFSILNFRIGKNDRALLEFRFTDGLVEGQCAYHYCFLIHWFFNFNWKREKILTLEEKYPLK